MNHQLLTRVPDGGRGGHARELLMLLEQNGPLSRARAATLSTMSESTLRRVCAELLREGLLSLRHGEEGSPEGRREMLCFAPFGILTMLELTPTQLLWRMADTRGEELHTLTRERNPFLPPEEDVRLLLGQISPFLTAAVPAAARLSAPPPVLLIPAGEAGEAMRRAPLCALAPAEVLTVEEAAAHELSFHPFTQDKGDLLLIRDGEEPYASLLSRPTPRESFTPSPHARTLTATLRRHISDTPIGSLRRAEGIRSFLRGLCQYLSPVCVVVECELHPLPDLYPEGALPVGIPLLTHVCTPSTPSLAHKGALRLSRQLLWCRRLEEIYHTK